MKIEQHGLWCVLAHGGAFDFVLRMARSWARAGYQGKWMTFITPADEKFPEDRLAQLRSCLESQIEIWPVGQSAREGIGCIDRVQVAAQLCGERPGTSMIMEFDTMLRPGWWLHADNFHPECLNGGWIFGSGDRQFQGTFYPHCPWVATQEIWRRIGSTAFPHDERGVPDRWLGYQVERNRIKAHSLGGWTQNTLLPEHHAQVRDAILVHGAQTVHGVKDAGTADFVDQLFKQRFQ